MHTRPRIPPPSHPPGKLPRSAPRHRQVCPQQVHHVGLLAEVDAHQLRACGRGGSRCSLAVWSVRVWMGGHEVGSNSGGRWLAMAAHPLPWPWRQRARSCPPLGCLPARSACAAAAGEERSSARSTVGQAAGRGQLRARMSPVLAGCRGGGIPTCSARRTRSALRPVVGAWKLKAAPPDPPPPRCCCSTKNGAMPQRAGEGERAPGCPSNSMSVSPPSVDCSPPASWPRPAAASAAACSSWGSCVSRKAWHLFRRYWVACRQAGCVQGMHSIYTLVSPTLGALSVPQASCSAAALLSYSHRRLGAPLLTAPRPAQCRPAAPGVRRARMQAARPAGQRRRL